MAEYAELPGWDVVTDLFDFGRCWGVGIAREGADGKARRYAVRVDAEDRDGAMKMALPALREWAAAHG